MRPKILLVEDDEKIVKALTVRLKSKGFDVIVAFDAVMAVSKAMESHPDIVLLDISMPGGNGFTVAERLRDSTVTSDIPLIFLTASKQPGLREKAMAFDAHAFFEKPFESDELIQSIRTCLQASSSFLPA